MRKELVFAIAAGAALGLIIAFGIWRINSTFSGRENKKEPVATTPKPEFSIALAKPKDFQVIGDDTVTLNGITKANALLVISGESKDYLVSAGDDGAFTQDIALIPGINEIILNAFDENGNASQTKLTLVYSSEFTKSQGLSAAGSSQTQTAGSEEADTVRQKVQEKVEAALKSPKAYIGTVTDITDSTLQIKTPQGEIQQVATTRETTFLKISKTSKEIKYGDIAIGDFIIAMGFKNGNNVLDTRRVLVVDAPSATSRHSIKGVVTATSQSGLTLQISAQKSLDVSLADTFSVFVKKDGALTKIKFAGIKEQASAIASGQDTKDGFEARTIFVIP